MMDGEQCLGAAGGSSPPLSRKQKVFPPVCSAFFSSSLLSRKQKAARGTLAKIDSVFSSVQALEAMSNLLEDCCSYLETQHQKEGGVKATVVNPLQLPCDCLRVAIDGLDKHASIISQAIINTSETKEVKYAQRKLMKSQSKNYAQQFNTNEVMMERDPKSALTSSLNFAKQSLDDILSRTSPDFIVPAVTAAKKKRKQSTLVEKPESATDGQAVGGARKKQKQLDGGGGGESKEIIDVIDLPQPMEGQIMYSPLETVSYIGNIIDNNPGKSYVKAYKDKLIAEKRIPIQKTQLNLLLKQYSASGGDGKSMAPLSWNERGVREAGLETLLAQFQAKQSKGGSWSIDDTRDALRRESKEEGPTEGVIESRHAMLTSLRKYQNHTAEQISMQELRLKEKPPTIPARRRKKQENQKSPSSLSTTRLKDRFDKNDKKYNHIKLPTPLGGFLYTPSEAVANIINYIESKPTPSRGDVRAFKEKMIAERVVP